MSENILEKLIVRKLEVSDIVKLAKLENQVFSDAWSEDILNALIKNSFDYAYIVQNSKFEIIAYINYRVIIDEAELMRIAVLPKYRGQKIGDDLVKYMFKNIEQKNINIVRLEVRSSNISALKLYKSNGFIESGIRKDYYNNPNEDAIIMEKKIC